MVKYSYIEVLYMKHMISAKSLIALLSIGSLLSCDGVPYTSNTSKSNSQSQSSSQGLISLDKSELELSVGRSGTIIASTSTDFAISWAIDDASMATLTPSYDSLTCTIKATKRGFTYIRASFSDGTDENVAKLYVSDTKNAYIGTSFEIEANITDVDASALVWSVGNESIVSIENTSGSKATLKPLEVGDTYVRAENSLDSSIFDECLIHVTEKAVTSWPVISDDAKDYYSSIDFTQSPSNLLTSLNALNRNKKKTNNYDATWEILSYAQADPNNESNVILIYSSESRAFNKNNINREHVWPNSRGVGKSGPGSDPHMLHLADTKENGDRGNNVYGNGSNSTYYVKKDEWKGACARAVMYTHVGYQHTGLVLNDSTANNKNNMGQLSVILEWEVKNPVKINEVPYEMFRNNRIQERVNNRNPFVDIPGLSLYLYGGFNATTKTLYHQYAASFGLDPSMY